MNHRDLTQLFEYDRWANGPWLECLERKGWPEPDSSVLQHILSGQEIWALRCRGTSLTEMPKPPATVDELDRLNQTWLGLLQELAHDPIIDYRRTTGEGLRARFSKIARHVCNHGTYHRGELRGLCRARGDDDFPETDFSRYMFEAGIELTS